MRRTVFSALGLIAAGLLIIPLAFTGAGVAADCSTSEYLGSPSIYCQPDAYNDSETYADVLSWYQHAVSIDAQDQGFRDMQDNYLQDTEKIAFLKAEQAIAEAAKNGSSESLAESKAREAVRAYYTIHQQNLIDHWDRMVASLEGLKTSNPDPSNANLTASLVVDQATGSASALNIQDPRISISGYGNTSIDLENGNTTESRTITVDFTVTLYYENANTYTDTTFSRTASLTSPNAGLDGTYQVNRELDDGSTDTVDATLDMHFEWVNMNAPPNEPDFTYLWPEGYGNDYTELHNQAVGVNDDAANFTQGVYTDLEAGTIDPDDILSRTNLMYEYLVGGQGENVTFNEGIAGLIASGFSTPAAGNSSYMNATYVPSFTNESITREGMLLSSNAPPNGEWEIGKTYYESNISGSQLYYTMDGDEHVINGSFTIHEVYDSDGNAVEKVNITSPSTDYKVTNTSELQELVTSLGDRIDTLQNRTTESSGTGPSGGGGSGILSALFGWIPNVFGSLAQAGKAALAFVVALLVLGVLMQ